MNHINPTGRTPSAGPARSAGPYERFISESADATLAGAKGLRPVIVKHTAHAAKTRRGVVDLVRYIARLAGRDSDYNEDPVYTDENTKLFPPLKDPSPVVYNPVGMELERDDILSYVETWPLLDDEENRSPLARAYDDLAMGAKLVIENGEGRINTGVSSYKVSPKICETFKKADILVNKNGGYVLGTEMNMPANLRFYHPQAHHFILSIPLGMDNENQMVKIFTKILGDAIPEMFGLSPLVWAVHREHGKFLHAHVVVSAYSYAKDKRMRIDKSGKFTDSLRQVLVETARAYGINNLTAVRRAAKKELVDKLIEGKELLPNDLSKKEYLDGFIPSDTKLLDKLYFNMPNWFNKFGLDFLSRRYNAEIKYNGKEADFTKPPQYLEDAFVKMGVYENPQLAASSFVEMAKDDKSQALWNLKHNPDHFGVIAPTVTPRELLGVASLNKEISNILFKAVNEVDNRPSVDTEILRKKYDLAFGALFREKTTIGYYKDRDKVVSHIMDVSNKLEDLHPEDGTNLEKVFNLRDRAFDLSQKDISNNIIKERLTIVANRSEDLSDRRMIRHKNKER